MGAKNSTLYVCSSCSHQETKWVGKCPQCQNWNTFVETSVKESSNKDNQPLKFSSSVQTYLLSDISLENYPRVETGITEFDRVLGGGLVPGSAILLGGVPGIGKSTLILQVITKIIQQNIPSIYISGEESPQQIKQRLERIKASETPIPLSTQTDLEEIINYLEQEKPQLILIDSLQTLNTSIISNNNFNNINQLRYCTQSLINWCKTNNSILILIAHVTKEGIIAGPKIVEHLVDTVLYFEHSTDETRILRATKNRFGAINEIGLFTMERVGLKEIENAQTYFMVDRNRENTPSGIVIAPVYEGSRILMIEIQALTIPAKGSVTRVFSDKVDSQRISRLAAILEKHANIPLSDQDIYINIAGGLKVTDVAIDLPLLLALYSARANRPIPYSLVTMGEVTLAGEIRNIHHLGQRIKVCQDIGFDQFIIPKRQQYEKKEKENILEFNKIEDIIQHIHH